MLREGAGGGRVAHGGDAGAGGPCCVQGGGRGAEGSPTAVMPVLEGRVVFRGEGGGRKGHPRRGVAPMTPRAGVGRPWAGTPAMGSGRRSGAAMVVASVGSCFDGGREGGVNEARHQHRGLCLVRVLTNRGGGGGEFCSTTQHVLRGGGG